MHGEQDTVGITKLPLIVPWLSVQLAVGPGLVVFAPPLVPQAYPAGVMAMVSVAVDASTALALVDPTQTVGAGMATADPVGPIGGTKLGAPLDPAPHQLQVLQLLRVTVFPGAVVEDVNVAVAGSGVGSLA